MIEASANRAVWRDIAQHMREIPDLGDEALGVHAALSRNGLTMVSPPKVRPCCMSSL